MSSLIQTKLSLVFHDFSPKRHHNAVGRAWDLGSNPGSWTSYLVSLRHGFLLFETISEIYESSKWHIVGLLYWLSSSLTTFSTVVPQEQSKAFLKLFLKWSWKLWSQTQRFPTRNQSWSFPYLAALATFPQLSSTPFQALPGKAQGICLMVQTSHFALSRACKNELLGGSGFSEGKAVSVILENIKMWKNFSSHQLVFLCGIASTPWWSPFRVRSTCSMQTLCMHGSVSLCRTNAPNRQNEQSVFQDYMVLFYSPPFLIRLTEVCLPWKQKNSQYQMDQRMTSHATFSGNTDVLYS